MSATLPAVPEPHEVADVDGLRSLLNHLRETYDRDPEAGHSIEDKLKDRVLRLTAEGHPDAARFAAMVLETRDWDVERWYA